MQRLFSEMLIVPGAGVIQRMRTASCLVALGIISAMVVPAAASVEGAAVTNAKRPESRLPAWTIAQGTPGDPPKRRPPVLVDPDTQGGAPFAPPPSASITPLAIPQYRVGGVASNDVLNIRSGPDAGSAIVSTIPPDGGGIRMTGSCSGNWCPIDYRGAQGWVNRRFLTSE